MKSDQIIKSSDCDIQNPNSKITCINKIYEMNIGVKPHQNAIKASVVINALAIYDKDKGPWRSVQGLFNKEIEPIAKIREFSITLTNKNQLINQDKMIELIRILFISTEYGSASENLFNSIKESICKEETNNVFCTLEYLDNENLLNKRTYNTIIDLYKSGFHLNDCNNTIEDGVKILKSYKILSELTFNLFCMAFASDWSVRNNAASLKAICNTIKSIFDNHLDTEDNINKIFNNQDSLKRFHEAINILTDEDDRGLVIINKNDNDSSFYYEDFIPKLVHTELNFIYKMVILKVGNDTFVFREQRYEIITKKLSPDEVKKLDNISELKKSNDSKIYINNSETVKKVKSIYGFSLLDLNILNQNTFDIIDNIIKSNKYTFNRNRVNELCYAFVRFGMHGILNDNFELLIKMSNIDVNWEYSDSFEKVTKQIVNFYKNDIYKHIPKDTLLKNFKNLMMIKDSMFRLNQFSICNQDIILKLLESPENSKEMAEEIIRETLKQASLHNKNKIYELAPKDVWLSMFGFFNTTNSIVPLKITCKEFAEMSQGYNKKNIG